MWPISTRVNKPENDDPSILDEVVLGPKLLNKMAGRQELNPLWRGFGDRRSTGELHPHWH
jgi:hypothetical protein